MLKTGCVLIFCAFAGGLAAVPNPVATRQFAHAVNLRAVIRTSSQRAARRPMLCTSAGSEHCRNDVRF